MSKTNQTFIRNFLTDKQALGGLGALQKNLHPDTQKEITDFRKNVAPLLHAQNQINNQTLIQEKDKKP